MDSTNANIENTSTLTSYVAINSTLTVSGTITIKGAKGFTGQDGSCPINTRVDYFVYGGTPPYRITQTFPTLSTA